MPPHTIDIYSACAKAHPTQLRPRKVNMIASGNARGPRIRKGAKPSSTECLVRMSGIVEKPCIDTLPGYDIV